MQHGMRQDRYREHLRQNQKIFVSSDQRVSFGAQRAPVVADACQGGEVHGAKRENPRLMQASNAFKPRRLG